ncbi:MAG: ferritin-like domain-containing protein [Acidimicrobiia bacterium]
MTPRRAQGRPDAGTPLPHLSRRELLRLGALTLGTGGLLAACGTQAGVEESPNVPSLGVAPETTALPAAEVTDAVLLRTAASLEWTAIDTYDAAIALGVLTGPYAGAATLARRFRDDHRGHADAVNALVEGLGAEPFECANARLMEIYVGPALALITADETADPAAEVALLAHALEQLATQTYQGVVTMLEDPALRAAALGIGGDESRHAALLARAISPAIETIGTTIDPATGKPRIAAVPGAFGSLATVQVTLGRDAQGAGTTLALDTPSLNSLAYDFVACA